jgi:hypothetical protein
VRYGDGNMRLCVPRAAGGGRRAAGGGGAGGVRRAVGRGSNNGDGDAQAAAVCGDVGLFSSCGDSDVI